eukprot:SAG11_NODE_316_length_10846_cov_8.188239_12_plen_166_part_00
MVKLWAWIVNLGLGSGQAPRWYCMPAARVMAERVCVRACSVCCKDKRFARSTLLPNAKEREHTQSLESDRAHSDGDVQRETLDILQREDLVPVKRERQPCLRLLVVILVWRLPAICTERTLTPPQRRGHTRARAELQSCAGGAHARTAICRPSRCRRRFRRRAGR